LAEETLHHVVASLMTILRVHGEAGEHDVLKIGIVVALQALRLRAARGGEQPGTARVIGCAGAAGRPVRCALDEG
jgi:hypothetical protein